MDLIDVEECAQRLGRMRRLTGDPIVIDLVRWDGAEADDDGLRLFLKTLGDTGGTTALIGNDEARVVRLLGSVPFELIADSAFPMDALVAAVRTAAKGADAHLTEDAAEAIARRFPLHVDGLEHAMALARSRPKDYDAGDPELARFTAACKEVATEGISRLAERIEPVFNLDDVVLPADRKEQLVEIVDNIRLRASRPRRMEVSRTAAVRPRRDGALLRPQRYRQDDGRDRHRAPARHPAPALRSVESCQQVHRRHRKEYRPRLHRRAAIGLRDPHRRGRRAARQAERGQGRARPVRQHRGRLPPPADGGVRRPGDPHHEHAAEP